jgi:hypothetical protein
LLILALVIILVLSLLEMLLKKFLTRSRATSTACHQCGDSPFHDSWQPLSESELGFKLLSVGGGMTPFTLLYLSMRASTWQIFCQHSLATHQWCSHLLLLSEYKVVLALFLVERLNTLN